MQVGNKTPLNLINLTALVSAVSRISALFFTIEIFIAFRVFHFTFFLFNLRDVEILGMWAKAKWKGFSSMHNIFLLSFYNRGIRADPFENSAFTKLE